MSRKKQPSDGERATDANSTTEAQLETAATTQLAELPETAPQPERRPDWIDGPPVDQFGNIIVREAQPKTWSNPYKAIVTARAFELGEDRQFKERVFTFNEPPPSEILATLKECGFTYRPAEKAWTIQATAATRELSDRLAREFAGGNRDVSR
jgi:hypothetical protein